MGTSRNGLAVPKSTATPRRITIIPRYIGLRVTRYIPLVTKFVDFSNGFIGVPTLPNETAGQITIKNPGMISPTPRYVMGAVNIVCKGAK